VPVADAVGWESELRIWHQSFTDLDAFPVYRRTLEEHAAQVAGPGVEVVVHGLRPGSYPEGVAPMDANRHPYVKYLGGQQICEAVLAAEAAGYDAFTLGCIFDPGLQAARSLVDIPVVSLAETCMLVACSLGRKFALVALNDFQKAEIEDRAREYRLTQRLAAATTMQPVFNLFALEDETKVRDIRAGFQRACEAALGAGAEVIIPGDGVLNEFLFRSGTATVENAVIMDAIGVLFHYAQFLAATRRNLGLSVSRRQHYLRPSPALLDHARNAAGLGAPDEGLFSGGKGTALSRAAGAS
jgi:allantoin racemase